MEQREEKLQEQRVLREETMSKLQYMSNLVMRNRGQLIVKREGADRIGLPLLMVPMRGDEQLGGNDREGTVVLRSCRKLNVISDADVIVCLFKACADPDLGVVVKQEEVEPKLE